MTTVEEITVDTDEQGWELHLVVGENIRVSDDGRVSLNIHGVAEDLLREVVTKIGPWLLEGYRIARSHARTPFDDEPAEREPGESAFDYYQRTGDAGGLLEAADALRDRGRGK